MASRYWVGGTAAWDATAGTKWSTTSGGAGGAAVPTAADDVFFNASSGAGTITMTGAASFCRSLNTTGFTGTLSYASQTIQIGDGTAGAGNAALTIGSGTNFTTNSTSTFSLVSTSATQQTITTNGKTLVGLTINGAGSSYLLSGTTTMSGAFTLNAGTFDTGNQTVTSSNITTGSATAKVLTLGSSTWTLSSTNTAMNITGTNITVNAGTSTINFNATVNPGGWGAGTTWYDIVSTGAGSIALCSSTGLSCHSITRTGTAAKTNGLLMNGNVTCSGTFTVNGNSTTNRVLIAGNPRGTNVTITAATTSFSNVDFVDIAIPPGVGSVITSDSFNRSGNLPGSTSDAASGGSGMTWSSASLGTWPITSNEVVPSYGTSGMPSILTLPIGVADVSISVKITGIPSGGNSVAMLILRHTDINNWMSVNIDQGGVLRIGGNIAGSWTANSVVASSGITVSLNDVLRADVIGDIVHVYKNSILGGTWRLSSAQAAAWSGTNHGLGAGAVTNSAKFDDFIVTNLTKMDLSSITGKSGDAGGNTGIIFTTPATQTATGTATIIWSTHSWSGSPSRVPLPQDDVIIANSFIAGRDITADMPRLGKNIDMSSCTGNPRFVNNSVNDEFYGSFSYASGMTTSGGNQLTAAGRGAHTITTNGISQTFSWSINGPGGTYTLADAFTASAAFTVLSGNFVSANYTITALAFSSTGTITRSVTLGSSTVNITQSTSGTVWNIASTGLTFSASSSTIVISTIATATRTFAGGGIAYGAFVYTVADSPGQLSITGSNSFTNLNIGSGRALGLSNATTTTLGTWTGSGTVNGYQYMPGASGNNVSVPDSAALSLTGDMDFRTLIDLTSWTPGAVVYLFSKRTGATAQSTSYDFQLSSAGNLVLTIGNGATSATATSSTAVTATPGTPTWVRATRRISDGRVQFFTSTVTDPSSPGDWTQVGTNQTNTNAGQDTADPVMIGTWYTGSSTVPMKLYRAQMRNNVLDDGTGIQLDVDFTTKAFGANSFTESSSNAATVTISGTLAQVGDGRLAILSLTGGSTTTFFSKPSGGPFSTTSDYLVITDVGIVQPLSFFAGANSILSNALNVYATAPGTYRYQQGIAGPSTAGLSILATYPTATTPGNLLVAEFTSSGSQTSFTPMTGWTQAVTRTSTTLVYIYYKIADGTESTVTFSQTQSRQLNLTISEYSGFTGTPTLDVTDSNANASASTSISTTATIGPTNTAQPALAFAYVANASTLGTTTGITNSFNEDRTTGNAGTRNKSFVKELTTLAAASTTISWSSNRSGVPIVLVVFKDSAVIAVNGSFLPFF